jgi:hypothetical protein
MVVGCLPRQGVSAVSVLDRERAMMQCALRADSDLLERTLMLSPQAAMPYSPHRRRPERFACLAKFGPAATISTRRDLEPGRLDL